MRQAQTGSQLRRGLRLQRMPAWVGIVAVAVLLAGSWVLVHEGGGSRTAFPHVFYLPIVLAALPFGIVGGVVTGLLATILSGPLMPLDVANGEMQQVVNWVTRGVFFVAVGTLSGATTQALRRSFASELSAHLDDEAGSVSSAAADAPDPAWRGRVEDVLERSAFRTVFQPIYRLGDGALIAVEALTRFEGEPAQPPDVWFDQAHRVGLGLDLELATLHSALRASRTLPAGATMTFNASPELVLDPRLGMLLDEHPKCPRIVEITEHAVIGDYLEVELALRSLRERGVRVAIDDAGAGFASLRHVVRLEPDLIKLDHSLTQNIRNDPVRGPLAEALLRFAERTDTRVVVEGIETAADLATWRDLGAYAAQGYALGRPGLPPFASTYMPLRHLSANLGARDRATKDRRLAIDRRTVMDRGSR
jgi:EAL domain-containing protein (putative c-di-GMP-specific phosphodiesterase class I)